MIRNQRDRNKLAKSPAMAAILSALLFSLVAHGFMFANNLSFHDDIGQLFTVGETYTLGRWFLGVLGKVWSMLFGNISMHWWNGLASSMWIALSAGTMVRLLKIRNTGRAILLGALLTVFPVVTCTYAFMFTAPFYFFGLFLCVLAVLFQEKGKFGFLLGVGCLSAAIGIYQAYFPVVLGLLLLLILLKGTQNKATWAYVLKIAGRYAAFVALGLAGYLLINKGFLWLLHLEMSSYQGLDNVYSGKFTGIGTQIIATYHDFFSVGYDGLHSTVAMKAAVWISFVADFLFAIYLLYQKRTAKKLKQVQTVVLAMVLILYPLAINCIYFIAKRDNTYIHHVMRYSLVMLWILPIILMELCDRQNHYKTIEPGKKSIPTLYTIIKYGFTGIMALQIVLYCTLDNAAYTKAAYIQEQSVAYFNTLIQSIKQTPGYKDEYPVAFLQDRQKSEASMTNRKELDVVQLIVLDVNMLEMVNDYAWETYMEMHCGYAPQKADNIEEIAKWPEVKKMPCYPDDGSIAVCRGVVVVKFADE